MKPVVNRALAVGILAAVTGVMFLFALTFFRKGGYSDKDSYLVHAFFSDATGLTWKSRVQIAGIQIGEVDEIRLEGAKARLDIRIQHGIELRTDACLTKTFPSALLPDALLEAVPGSSEKPTLESLPEAERVITCVREATSVQQLLDSMAQIAKDVQTVTGDLAKTVSGDRGSLREIVENLSSVSRRIDETIAQNQESVTQLIASARDFSGDLAEISRRDKDKIHAIATNIEDVTARLRIVLASVQDIVDPGSGGVGPVPTSRDTSRGNGAVATTPPGNGAVATTPPGNGAVATAPPPSPAPGPAAGQQQAAEMRGVRQAIDRLNGSLGKLDDMMGKVNEGKSIAGKLLVDEKLGRQLGEAVDTVTEYVDRLEKLQVELQLRSEWLLNQSIESGVPGTKIYFGARIIPKPDKYYLIELVSDPRGVNTRTTETITTRDPVSGGSTTETRTRVLNEEKLTISAQLAKRYGPLTFRIGVIEGSGGLGADVHLLRDKLQMSLSMYQFSRPFQDVYPRAKFWVNYHFFQHFYVTSGVDDFLNRWRTGAFPGGQSFNLGTDVFFGGGLYFTDDDIKALLLSGAGSAASAGGG